MYVMVSLFVIVSCTLLAPVLARVVFRNIIPETVFLILLGMLIGQHALGLAQVGAEIGMLRELGIAFLFLLAGFEVDVEDLRGKPGLAALAAWLTSLLTAFLIVLFGTYLRPSEIDGAAVAIVMTATALGTLLPILKDRGLTNTTIGRAVMAHGTVGEIGPIVMMAVALSFRATWQSILVLVAFFAIGLLMVAIPKHVRKFGHKITDFIHWSAETTAQTTVRLTVVLLVGLVALAEVMDLDIVLGAFVAGFIVRQAIPEGREELEKKLDGLGYGFFIPIFFVISGMQIDLGALKNPLPWLVFLFVMMLVRGVPVFLSTWIFPGGGQKTLLTRNRITIGLYSTTSLPIIVAVTHVAVSADALSEETASILVIAGVASVLLMPVLAFLTQRAAEADLLHPRQRKQRISAARPQRPTEKSKESSQAMRARRRPSTVKTTAISKKKRGPK